LVNDIDLIVKDFAATPDNRDVYAFVIEFDACNDAIYAKWNTEQHVTRHSPPGVATGLGLADEYQSGDFPFVSEEFTERVFLILREVSIAVHASIDKEKERERRRQCLACAIRRCENSFKQFDMTSNFVAFVLDYQRSWQEWISLASETVPPDMMEIVFPGVMH